jgi:CxxC-x17-CxxC domain-containing protein
MGDFRRGGGKRFGGGGGGFRGRDGGRDRDRGPVTMHQAVCDQCGKNCEVPFRPSGDKPVYCNDCFGSKKDSGGSRGSDRYSQKSFDSKPAVSSGGNDEVKKQLVMLNEKMERLIKAVELGSQPRPLAIESKVKKIVKSLPVTKAKKVAKKKTNK